MVPVGMRVLPVVVRLGRLDLVVLLWFRMLLLVRMVVRGVVVPRVGLVGWRGLGRVGLAVRALVVTGLLVVPVVWVAGVGRGMRRCWRAMVPVAVMPVGAVMVVWVARVVPVVPALPKAPMG